MAATRTVRGLVLTEHEFSVPLDHARPDGDRIDVFAREVAAEDGRDRPFLVFLQGGPGSEAPRPTEPDSPLWLPTALKEYRVLLLDQRGTGRSTPVGTLPGLSAEEQAAYLQLHRADSIVRDTNACENGTGASTRGIPRIAIALHARLAGEELLLPSGDRLTPRRLRQLGAMLGMSDGAERLHYLLELPPDSPAFRHDVEADTSFARNPLYAIVHEACYADGCATRWSAERLLPDDFASSPELFTGEMVYSWMFADYGSLAPLHDAAELLAAHEWPRLYDGERLEANDVPVAAAVYAEDMYVERVFSEETAARIKGLRMWLTNEFEHDGLRKDERVLGRLIDLARGRG